MNDYKSPASRLVRWFKQSRDNWKDRSKKKQEKIRALETTVRDINQSRAHWKEKAKQAKQELAQLKKQLATETGQDTEAVEQSSINDTSQVTSQDTEAVELSSINDTSQVTSQDTEVVEQSSISDTSQVTSQDAEAAKLSSTGDTSQETEVTEQSSISDTSQVTSQEIEAAELSSISDTSQKTEAEQSSISDTSQVTSQDAEATELSSIGDTSQETEVAKQSSISDTSQVTSQEIEAAELSSINDTSQVKEAKKTTHSTQRKWQKIVGHHYPAEIVKLGIEQVVHSLNSLRGSQKTFDLFNQYFKIGVPSYNSIRSWMLRVGLYELKQQPKYDEDWIMMLDATIELGNLKCLGILGIPMSRLSDTGYALKHLDVDVLELVVLSSCTGEVVNQQLEQVIKQHKRPPLQIVSDHGGDIKKGIGLYKQKHPKLIWTHDITHAMALLLKKELDTDETYQTFMRQGNVTRQQIKQTPLYFLSPPKQRPKARYLNIESRVRWAQQLLHYQDQADFSVINPQYQLDKLALSLLQTQLDPGTLTDLSLMECKIYSDRDSFCHHLSHYLGADRWAEYELVLCQAANLGRRYFEEKLGWVSDYRSVLPTYVLLSNLVNSIAQQLKQQGLNRSSLDYFVKQTDSLTLSTRLQRFRDFILAYLRTHIEPLSSDQTVLASSDVLESIFGKYKLFSAERSFKEIGQMILTIPLFTTKLTPQRVKLALETISMSDVQSWAKQTFGQSMLSKRRRVLKPTQIVREKPT